jgi:hypothetical protein
MSIPRSVPAQSYYGTPVDGKRLAATGGARPATASAPYLGRGNKCSAKDDTCEGNRVKDEVFCAGHLRSARKDKVEEVTDGV